MKSNCPLLSESDAELVLNCFNSLDSTNLLCLDRDTLALERFELLALCLKLFVIVDAPKMLNLSLNDLVDLFVTIESMYMDNPYHNFRHAVDVAFFCTYLIDSGTRLTKMEPVILLLAALCHDMGHPARNNAFLAASNSPLVAMFGPNSTLEAYAADLAASVLLNTKFSPPPPFTRKHVVLSVQTAIIYSDASLHSELFAMLSKTSVMGFHSQSVPILLHAADISNTVRSWPLCRRWSALVAAEFSAQRTDEQNKNLASGLHVPTDEALGAIGFSDGIVAPLYSAMIGRLITESAGAALISRLKSNRALWVETAASPMPVRSSRRLSVAAGTVLIPRYGRKSAS